MKVSAKRKDTVPGEFNHDAVFEADDPPAVPATASTAKDSMFGRIDDDVLACCNSCYIGTTPDIVRQDI
jgi:hypothetical protein